MEAALKASCKNQPTVVEASSLHEFLRPYPQVASLFRSLCLPLTIVLQALGAGFFRKLGVKSVLMLLNALHIGRIDTLIPRQRHILVDEDVLYLINVNIAHLRAVANRHGSGNAGSLSGTNALRYEIEPVDSNVVRRQVTSRTEDDL